MIFSFKNRSRGPYLGLSNTIQSVCSVASFAEHELRRATNTCRTASNSNNQVANRSNASSNSHCDEAGRSAEVNNSQIERAANFCVSYDRINISLVLPSPTW
jgi:hypothetical protein